MTGVCYVCLKVEGIQAFLFVTGKLKEMIGASECVRAFTDTLLEKTCRELGLEILDLQTQKEELLKAVTPHNGKWVCLQQQSAGTLRCVLADEGRAKDFVTQFSCLALEMYPGLPFFGAIQIGEWNVEGLERARRALDYKIQCQRAEFGVPCGMPQIPFAETAPLDGLPAVGKEKTARPGENSYISLPSQTRRDISLLAAANERLKNTHNKSLCAILKACGFDQLSAEDIRWTDDMDDMLAKCKKKRLALIHMDGNDLGKLFQDALKKQQGGPEVRQQKLADLSKSIENAVDAAFVAALEAVVTKDARQSGQTQAGYTVPLRPLVLGGDDVTVITRADVALPFVRAFTSAFELETAKHGHRCSMGAGMVIMPVGYPFAKAWTLCDDLCKNAKKKTIDMEKRPSSLDWLVLTSDVEDSVSTLRERTAKAADGKALTCKPFILDDAFAGFLRHGEMVLDSLPRSHVREAVELCRAGEVAARPAYDKLRENVSRGLGGRHDEKSLSEADFYEIFPQSFFCYGSDKACPLADWLELTHLGIGESHA